MRKQMSTSDRECIQVLSSYFISLFISSLNSDSMLLLLSGDRYGSVEPNKRYFATARISAFNRNVETKAAPRHMAITIRNNFASRHFFSLRAARPPFFLLGGLLTRRLCPWDKSPGELEVNPDALETLASLRLFFDFLPSDDRDIPHLLFYEPIILKKPEGPPVF